LKREVAIMKALKKHPNIIELIDVIDEERKDKKYIVVELANGCTLQELLASAPDSVRWFNARWAFFVCLPLLPSCSCVPLGVELWRPLGSSLVATGRHTAALPPPERALLTPQ